MSTPASWQGITCAEFAAGVVTDYMEDALPADRRAAVDDHLSGCAICTRLLAGLRRVTVAIRGIGRDNVDARSQAALLAECRAALAKLRGSDPPLM